MAKVKIDWGDTTMDEFNTSWPIARAVFTLLSRMSDTWTQWQPVTKDSSEVFLCDPEKNLTCKKSGCQIDCFLTTKRECSRDGYKYCYDGKALKSFIPEEKGSDNPEIEKDLTDINKITEFRRDEENKTPEL